MIMISFFSTNYSPLLFHNEFYDAAYYDVIGHALNNGKLVYKDYIDVKGPIFFLVQMLGNGIHPGRSGMFLIEVVLMIISDYFLVKINALNKNSLFQCIILYVAYHYVYVALSWGLCQAEGLVLPFLIAGLYMGLNGLDRIRRNEKPEHIMSFCMGVILAICFFSKITTVVTILSVVLILALTMIRRKLFYDLGRMILLIAAGFVILSLLVMLYHGFIGTLSEMLYWGFAKALKRGVVGDHVFSVKDILYLLVCYFSMIYVYVKYKVKAAGEEDALLFVMSFITVIVLQFGGGFEYYFLAALPVIVLVFSLVYKDIDLFFSAGMDIGRKNEIRVLFFGILCLMSVLFSYSGDVMDCVTESYSSVTNDGSDMREDMDSLLDRIPVSQRDDLFCMGEGIFFFDHFDLIPANSCPGFAVNLDLLKEDLPTQRKKELLEQKPEWIVTRNLERMEKEEVYDTVYELYDKAYVNRGGYELWKRKEQ